MRCAAGEGDRCLPASISDDGRLVAFVSGATDLLATPVTGTHAYLRSVDAGTTQLLDRSPPGAPGDDEVQDYLQLYLRDLASGTTRLVSRTPSGALTPLRRRP